MEYFAILILMLWGANIFFLSKLITEHTYLWQIKEYRLDRMISFLKNELHFKPRTQVLISWKLLVILNSLWLFSSPNILNFAVIFADFAFNIFMGFEILHKIFKKQIKFPKKSLRNLLILVWSAAIILLPLIGILNLIKNVPGIKHTTYEQSVPFWDIGQIASDLDNYQPQIHEPEQQSNAISLSVFILSTLTITNILFSGLSFLITGFAVILTQPLAIWHRKRIIQKAKLKLTKYPELKVIGITGSYGKTSTKEILVKILSSKYKVGFTLENMNTEVGVALSLLNNLPLDSEYFVMEVGAYQKGEILKSTQIIHPDIAIVTNVGNSHIDIFKNIENIAAAKSELIEGLKAGGKTILNFTNTYTRQMAKQSKNTYFYEVSTDNKLESNESDKHFYIFDITWNEPSVKFKAMYADNTIEIQTKLIGHHQLQNLAAAMLCAILCGFSLKELQHLLKNMYFESSHFKVYKGQSGVNIIDDGYNSNPEGFTSALTHLKLINSKKKVLFTRGIPELGKELRGIYSRLSDKIYSSTQVFMTTDPIFFEIINKNKPKNFEAFLVEENEKLKSKLKKYLTSDSTLLIEGRINPALKKFITNFGPK